MAQTAQEFFTVSNRIKHTWNGRHTASQLPVSHSKAGGLDSLSLSRRRLMGFGGGLAFASLAGLLTIPRAFADMNMDMDDHDHAGAEGDNDYKRWVLPKPRQLTLATNANAVCIAPVTIAKEKGFFQRYNLDIDYVNFGNSTDVLLDAIASGKADAGIGMALRWLKALEQGFDVKLTAGTHGGCLHLIGPAQDKITSIAELKGKTVAVTDMADPGKNFFAILLNQAGIDPNNDIEWRVYPADLITVALEKGEAQAAVASDPWAYRLLQEGKYVEIANNMQGDFAHLSCCVVGMTGELVRNDTPTAAALTRAILDAHSWAAEHPQEVGQIFQKHALNIKPDEVKGILNTQSHNHHATGEQLAEEVKVYADDLQKIGVIRPTTNIQRFAQGVTYDVFA